MHGSYCHVIFIINKKAQLLDLNGEERTNNIDIDYNGNLKNRK